MAQDAESPEPPRSLLSSRVFNYPKDLDILNEMDEVYFQIWDMTPNEQRAVWGNDAWLELNGLSLEALQNYNLRDCSQAVRDWQLSLYRKIQVEHRDDVSIKTIYPSAQGGKPITLRLTMRPMRLKFPEEEQDRVVIVSNGVPVEKDQDDFVRAQEMLRYTQVVQVIFTHETSAVVYGNVRAELAYPQIFSKEENARNDGLSKILDTCVWEYEDRVTAEDQIRSLTLQSTSIEIEKKKVSSGSDAVWHKLVFTPCTDPVTGKFSISLCEYDVSETKMEQAFNKAKDEFLAVISHELRTPLNGIIGLSDALCSLPECPRSMMQTLELICTSGHRLNGLVNDILDSASAKQNRLSLVFQPMRLAQCCDQVCKVLSATCKDGVHIVNKVEDTLCEIEADAGRVTQVLTNLVSNAIKFTARGKVELRASAAGSEVRVEVSDTGVGIPEAQLGEVWQAFRQGDMSATRKYEGTGLGLSLVRSLVVAHGGSVGVSSHCGGPNSGSTFFFSLPIKQPILRCTSDPLQRSDAPARSAPLHLSQHCPEFSLGSSDKTASSSSSQAEEGGGLERGEVACQTEPEGWPQGPRQPRQQHPRPLGFPEGGEGEEGETTEGGEQGAGRGKDGGGRGGRRGARGARRARAAARKKKGTLHYSELNGGQVEIMTVDDSKLNQAVIEATFAPKGFKVTKCMGGQELLDLLSSRGFLPDLVLLDVMMPDMDGYELCERLRLDYPCNALPVIMVSAKDKHADVVKGLESGCNDYVSKPFHNSELSARIDVQLKMRSLWNAQIERLLEDLSRTVQDESASDTASSAPASPTRSSPGSPMHWQAVQATGTVPDGPTGPSRRNLNGGPQAVSGRHLPQSDEHESASGPHGRRGQGGESEQESSSGSWGGSSLSGCSKWDNGGNGCDGGDGSEECELLPKSPDVNQISTMDLGTHAVNYVLENLPADVRSRLPNGNVVVWVGSGGRRPSMEV